MIKLIERLKKYGRGWGFYLRVEENNGVTLWLEYFDEVEMKVYHDKVILTKAMISEIREHGNSDTILYTLDAMRKRVQNQMK
jgi:hypothetical protein